MFTEYTMIINMVIRWVLIMSYLDD
ncbi:hypothetical protein LCGC14_1668640, partial [marine sediment metagenome]